MTGRPPPGDAFGALLTRHLRTRAETEVVERCGGRVLDVGAGAGRASLEPQRRGAGAVLLGAGSDPYAIDDPVHLAHQGGGRAAGPRRHPLSDHPRCSPEELDRLLEGTVRSLRGVNAHA